MASLMAHKQETVNFPQSQSVAQNLLSASMCEILYRRGILDGDLFEPITFAKNTLHKISDEAIERSPKAAKLYVSLSSCPDCALRQRKRLTNG